MTTLAFMSMLESPVAFAQYSAYPYTAAHMGSFSIRHLLRVLSYLESPFDSQSIHSMFPSPLSV